MYAINSIQKNLTIYDEVFVGAARFELTTSWSQTRRDNRATLHPELWLSFFKNFLQRRWQDLNLRSSRSQSGRNITGLRYIPNLKSVYKDYWNNLTKPNSSRTFCGGEGTGFILFFPNFLINPKYNFCFRHFIFNEG